MTSAIPIKSEAYRHAVTECPKCGSRSIRGPFDTRTKANFLFTRTYCCLTCWWDRDLQMFDDIAQAEKLHERKEKKKTKNREQARRT